MPSVICSTDTGNWSTSQPSRSSPALASIEPKMPALTAVGDLVGEVVAGERGVVDLDVDLDLVVEAVLLQERVHGGDVVVVLVLGRLDRLRLDQDRALEPDRVLVLDDHVQEPAELVELALHVGVEQRLVALAAAPQHVVLRRRGDGWRSCSAPPGRRRRRTPRGRGWWPPRPCTAGWRTGWRCPTAARRRCAPCARRRRSTISSRLRADSANVAPSGAMSTIVEAEERHAELLEELERGLHLRPRRPAIGSDVDERRVPRPVERAGAEDVEAVPVERVPVADARTAGDRAIVRPGDDPVGVVPAERERVVAVGALVADRFGNGVEERHVGTSWSRRCLVIVVVVSMRDEGRSPRCHLPRCGRRPPRRRSG